MSGTLDSYSVSLGVLTYNTSSLILTPEEMANLPLSIDTTTDGDITVTLTTDDSFLDLDLSL